MQKQKIALPDGRYLIYYTFDKQTADKQVGKTNDRPQISDLESAEVKG